MRFEIRSADGTTRTLEARDWMMAMCAVVAEEKVEVSGWMCFNRPDGRVDVFDPTSGLSWLVHTLDRETAAPSARAATPAPAPRVHPMAVPVAVADDEDDDLDLSPSTSEVEPPPPPAPVLQPQRARSIDVWKPPPGLAAEERDSAPADLPPEDLAERLFELSADLVSAGSANAAAKLALDILMQLIPCEAGSVLRGTRRDGQLTFVAVSGPAAKQLIGKKMRFEQGVVGATFDLGITIQVNDVASDARYLDRFDKETGFQTRSVLCIPVRAQHAVFGAVELLNPVGAFQPWHVETMENVARNLAEIFRD